MNLGSKDMTTAADIIFNDGKRGGGVNERCFKGSLTVRVFTFKSALWTLLSLIVIP